MKKPTKTESGLDKVLEYTIYLLMLLCFTGAGWLIVQDVFITDCNHIRTLPAMGLTGLGIGVCFFLIYIKQQINE